MAHLVDPAPVREPSIAGGDLVQLDDVAVTIRRTPVLRGVDLRLAAGETLGVLGANGSGKSTLLRLLATLVRPSAGRATILGQPLHDGAGATVRPRISLVGHRPGLYPQLSLAENLAFLARVAGRETTAVDRALATVGLGRAAQRRVAGCSHGMVRRAELAGVLLAQPQLLLLDEVHAGLDRDAVGLVDEIVDQVASRGGGCVLVSHEPSRFVGLADRLVRVADGRVHPAGGPCAVPS